MFHTMMEGRSGAEKQWSKNAFLHLQRLAPHLRAPLISANRRVIGLQPAALLCTLPPCAEGIRSRV